MTLASLDLNLLVTLRALLELRSVTRAGERLHLSQPATSTALAKLRRHFDDDLLARIGRDYELTPVGHALLPLVTEAVLAVERAFEVRPVFDAAVSERRFLVAASDYAATILVAPLRELMAHGAPGVSVDFVQMPLSLSAEHLVRYDALVAPFGYGIDTLHEVLFRDEFVCVAPEPTGADARSPEAVVELLRSHPHAALRLGDGVSTHADRLREHLGVERRPAVTLPGMAALPVLVRNTDLVTLVPRRLAALVEPIGGLRILPVPGAGQVPLVEAIYWQRSRHNDPAVQWLRASFKQAADRLV